MRFVLRCLLHAIYDLKVCIVIEPKSVTHAFDRQISGADYDELMVLLVFRFWRKFVFCRGFHAVFVLSPLRFEVASF
jgi:hypothetical protein